MKFRRNRVIVGADRRLALIVQASRVKSKVTLMLGLNVWFSAATLRRSAVRKCECRSGTLGIVISSFLVSTLFVVLWD